jgi:hypothetical protein
VDDIFARNFSAIPDRVRKDDAHACRCHGHRSADLLVTEALPDRGKSTAKDIA